MVSEWNGHLEFFSRPQAIENCVGNICFLEQIIYRKQSLNAPELGSKKKRFMVDFDWTTGTYEEAKFQSKQ